MHWSELADLSASQLSRQPAAGAAQLSRNFQDKQLQGWPPLNTGISQLTVNLFYIKQITVNDITPCCKKVLVLWNEIKINQFTK